MQFTELKKLLISSFERMQVYKIGAFHALQQSEVYEQYAKNIEEFESSMKLM